MKNTAQIAKQLIIEEAQKDNMLNHPLSVCYGDLNMLHAIANMAGIVQPVGRPNYYTTLRVLDHLDRHCKRPDSMFVKSYININRGVGGRCFWLKPEHHPNNIGWEPRR